MSHCAEWFVFKPKSTNSFGIWIGCLLLYHLVSMWGLACPAWHQRDFAWQLSRTQSLEKSRNQCLYIHLVLRQSKSRTSLGHVSSDTAWQLRDIAWHHVWSCDMPSIEHCMSGRWVIYICMCRPILRSKVWVHSFLPSASAMPPAEEEIDVEKATNHLSNWSCLEKYICWNYFWIVHHHDHGHRNHDIYIYIYIYIVIF